MKRFLPVFFALAATSWLQADPGQEIRELSRDPENLGKGETIYKQMCFACHGMNLEGAAGPNLIDATWLHGATPADIYNIITKGVSEKGMMAYEAVYDEAARKALAAYILSKQEGPRDVRYEIYPAVDLKKEELPAYGSGEPIKSGEIADALVDLSPAEIEDFSIVFKGKFLVPTGGKYIFGRNIRDGEVRFSFNGKVIDGEGKQKRYATELPPGEYDLEVAYQRTDGTPRMLLMDVQTPAGLKFPMSRDSHQILKTASNVYAVTDQARVVRTVLEGIPFESLAVGLPGGISYTVGRDGAITSVWDGLFLDTGPNVSERGKAPAKTGMPWYGVKDGVQLLVDGKPAGLRLKEYRLESQSPFFEFANGDAKLTVRSDAGEGKVTFTYGASGLEGELQLSVPASVRLEGDDKPLSQPKLIPVEEASHFSLTLLKP